VKGVSGKKHLLPSLYGKGLRIGLLACFFSSCSDFSSYNSVVESSNPSADRTLWENISAKGELSDFAQILQAVGYDAVLNAPTTYTVWAPVNGTFNKDSIMALAQDAKTKKKVIEQFVYDHLANYSHLESDPNDTVVYMLSKKLIRFSGKNTNSLTFDGKAINWGDDAFNTPSSNGILYTLNGMVPFRPNAYENIFSDKSQYGIADSHFNAYVKRYERIVLDKDASVKGEIVNGNQVYDDSVTVTTNSFVTSYSHLNAELNNEDSLYTIIIPTDAAWQKAYDKIKSYYNYITPIKYQNLSSTSTDFAGKKGGTCPTTSTGKATILSASAGVDANNAATLSAAPSDAEIQDTKAYWTDSITKRWIVRNAAFSETNRKYNSKLVSGTAFVRNDTLFSTSGNKLTGLDKLDEVTVLRQQLSNGHARMVNDFPYRASETYAPVIKTRTPGRVVSTSGYGYDNFYMERRQFDDSFCKLDDDEENLKYVRASLPEGSNFAPEMDFYLPDVLSTTYDIYAVVVPAKVDGSGLPYTLRFDLHYTDSSNQPQTGRLDGETLQTTIAKISKVPAFVNNPTKVDTLYLGRFTFPICYYGTKAAPNLKVMSTLSSFSISNKTKYDAQIRIANIILKPKDLEDNEQNATKED
jgi:uncharacterized surface protein with fasciclin (FAS1) repeats